MPAKSMTFKLMKLAKISKIIAKFTVVIVGTSCTSMLAIFNLNFEITILAIVALSIITYAAYAIIPGIDYEKTSHVPPQPMGFATTKTTIGIPLSADKPQEKRVS